MQSITFHIKGIQEVFRQLSKGNFLWYFLPGAIITIIYFWLNYKTSQIVSGVNFLDGIPLIGSYLNQGVDAAFSMIGFIFDQIYIFIIITILSPFNTHLSEKLDTSLSGQKFESGILRIFNDLMRMIFIVFIAVSLEFLLLGVWWIISWMFGIGDTIYELISFIMASFFFGFSFYDHSLERYDIGVFGSLGFAFKKIFMVTITGAIFQLLYYFPYTGGLPYIGIVIAPVLTTMISTIVFLHYKTILPKKLDNNTQTIDEQFIS